jgi:hypothetical protein
VTEDERGNPPNTKPSGYRLPQIILEGVLRRSLKSDVITFRVTLLRIIELTFLVVLPEEGRTKAPVFMRAFVNPAAGDKPGSIVIGD